MKRELIAFCHNHSFAKSHGSSRLSLARAWKRRAKHAPRKWRLNFWIPNTRTRTSCRLISERQNAKSRGRGSHYYCLSPSLLTELCIRSSFFPSSFVLWALRRDITRMCMLAAQHFSLHIFFFSTFTSQAGNWSINGFEFKSIVTFWRRDESLGRERFIFRARVFCVIWEHENGRRE